MQDVNATRSGVSNGKRVEMAFSARSTHLCSDAGAGVVDLEVVGSHDLAVCGRIVGFDVDGMRLQALSAQVLAGVAREAVSVRAGRHFPASR